MRRLMILILFFLLHRVLTLYGQTAVNTNSAQISDPRLLFVNPAGMAFHEQGRFVSGYKLYYVGLENNRIGNFYSGVSYRVFNAGILGVTGQIFSSAIFHQTRLNFNYALAGWKNKLAFGVQLGMLNIGYEQTKFHRVDLNDPLLQNNPGKMTSDLGLGILLNPVTNLYFGLNANHLNRPSLALVDSKDKQPITANLGAFYHSGIFRPYLGFELENREIYLNAGLETGWLQDRVCLRTGYSDEKLAFGAGFKFRGLRLDYEYDYLLSDLRQISSGSHQLTCSYQIEKPKPTPVIEIPVIEIPPPISDFDIQLRRLDSSTDGIYAGQTASYQISILPSGDFSEKVTLQVLNPPSGFATTFSAPQITPANACTLQVSPTCECLPGVHNLVIAGHAIQVTHLDSLQILVRLPRLEPEISSQPASMVITEKRKIFEESPLLNYIFFEANQDQIPAENYTLLTPAQAVLAVLEDFIKPADVAAQYRQVLNIFGRRLQDHPEFKIVLTGCNADTNAEKNNLDLSRRRAEHVQDYLAQVWKISRSRISIVPRNRPEYPSTMKDVRGHAENRRVEILPQSGSEKILAAFTTARVETEIPDSNGVFLTNGTVAEAGIQAWRLSVHGPDGASLYLKEGLGRLPDSIGWNWRELACTSYSFHTALLCSLQLIDNCGQTRMRAGNPIRIERKQQEMLNQLNILRARLVFFAFDQFQIDLNSARLQAELEKIMSKYQEHPGARIQVNGYTDDIGDPLYNEILSKRRAEEIKNELVRRGIPENKISTTGFGSKFPLMSNALPEGRMLNRRVEVDVISTR